MKKVLLFLTIIFGLVAMNIFPQIGWTAKILVYDETYVAGEGPLSESEYNVHMRIDLYHDGAPVSPQSNYVYNWWRYEPNSNDPHWFWRETITGDNTAHTHTYIDSTEDLGLIDHFCTVTIPGVGTIISDTTRIPWYQLIIDQKKSNGSFGNVDVWYKGNYKHNGLGTTYVPRYDSKIIRADTNVTSDTQEKYQYWIRNLSTVYYNNFVHYIPIDILSTAMKSQFYYTKNATVRVKVENSYLDILSFKDPWLRDYNEAPFGVRNQGLSAQSKTLSNVDNNLAITSSHKGVLLNQGSPNWNPPYYLISIPSSINLPQNGGTHNLYLQRYDTSQVKLQYPTSLNTGVVFTGNNATVTANIKATQLSDNQTAFINNSSRKLIKTPDGVMHLVYKSLEHVWYETKINENSDWQLMNNGQPL